MSSEQLVQFMKQVEEKGIDWKTIEEKTKAPKQILDLYTNSGPVPVTITNSLKKLLEDPPE